jgi:hypothetical protein
MREMLLSLKHDKKINRSMEEKMKKIIFCLLAILLFLFSDAVHATEVIPLPDLLKPQTITADRSQLYITAGTTIHIYSLQDYRLKKSFGQKGEGPGEFKSYWDMGVRLDVQSDTIFVHSRGKVSYFTKAGEFLNEIRLPNGFFHKPLGDSYVALRGRLRDNIRWNTVNIYDKDFNLVKEIGHKAHWFQPGQKIDPVDVRNLRFCVYGGRIYLENQTGKIDVFGAKGQLLLSTQQSFDRAIITEKDKEDYHTYYKTHPAYKTDYHSLKQLIKFPEYYPFLKYFDVADDCIYVFTYIKKDGKSELYLFDLNGGLKKKIYLSMPDINPQQVYPLVTVRNGNIYQLIENEDSEEWELHVTNIPNGK